MPDAYEELKKEIERRILELASIKQTGGIEVYKELSELIFIAEENLHINTEAAKRRYWDDWHMVREFVQNALDAVGKVDLMKVNNTLIISDLGKGFDIDAFIIGGTTKNPFCSRGRFGEGMKYAICVALNKGYDLTIITRDNVLKFVNKVAAGYKIPTVHLVRYKISKPIVGTRVIIQNYYGPDFRERFLFYDGKDAYRIRFIVHHDRREWCGPTGLFRACIMEPGRAIFVRDIFVEEEKNMLYSYNLIDVELDADRNIPKREDKEREICELWFTVLDSDLIYELLEKISEHESTKNYRTEVFEGCINWSYQFRRLKERIQKSKITEEEKKKNLEIRIKPWREAVERFERKILKKLCLAFTETVDARVAYYTADRYTSAVKYFGDDISVFLRDAGIIPDADEVVRQHAPKTVEEVPPRAIKAMYGEEGYRVIMKWLRYLQTIADHLGLHDYKVLVGRASPGVTGACDTVSKKIYIMIDTFRGGFGEVLETFTHELVHALYPDFDEESNTLGFVNKQVSILIKIQIGTLDRTIPLPREFVAYLP